MSFPPMSQNNNIAATPTPELSINKEGELEILAAELANALQEAINKMVDFALEQHEASPRRDSFMETVRVSKNALARYGTRSRRDGF